jgi:hypothetical protein
MKTFCHQHVPLARSPNYIKKLIYYVGVGGMARVRSTGELKKTFRCLRMSKTQKDAKLEIPHTRHFVVRQLSEKLNHKWKPEKSQSLLDKVGVNLRLLGALEINGLMCV